MLQRNHFLTGSRIWENAKSNLSNGQRLLKPHLSYGFLLSLIQCPTWLQLCKSQHVLLNFLSITCASRLKFSTLRTNLNTLNSPQRVPTFMDSSLKVLVGNLVAVANKAIWLTCNWRICIPSFQLFTLLPLKPRTRRQKASMTAQSTLPLLVVPPLCSLPASRWKVRTLTHTDGFLLVSHFWCHQSDDELDIFHPQLHYCFTRFYTMSTWWYASVSDWLPTLNVVDVGLAPEKRWSLRTAGEEARS